MEQDTAVKIGFIVEGDADKLIVETLARRVLGPRAHVHAVRLGGKAALPWAYTTVLLFLEKGYAHVLVVIDADSAEDEEVQSQTRTIERSLAEHHIQSDEATVCLAAPTIEAWLLSEYTERPESTANPKVELARHLGVPSVGAAEAEALAKRLDVERARRRSPSFQRFALALERAVKEIHAQAPAA